MFSYWLPVLTLGVVGYFLTRWSWRQGFRSGYMAGMTDTQQALAEQLGRLIEKGAKNG